MMLALLAFEVTVYRHQELYRLRCNKVPPRSRTLFHDISRHHLDQSVLSCAKYFLNYVFYKFGLEVSGRRHSSERHEKLEGGVGGGTEMVNSRLSACQTCFLLAVNVIGQRMDLFAVGHALGLICILSRRSRKRIASLWPKYCYFLSALLCLQYLLCIGFPPAACKGKGPPPDASRLLLRVIIGIRRGTRQHTNSMSAESESTGIMRTSALNMEGSTQELCLEKLWKYVRAPFHRRLSLAAADFQHGLQCGEMAFPARLPDSSKSILPSL